MAADYLSEALVVAEVGPVLEIVEEARKIAVGTWWERAWGTLEKNTWRGTGHLKEANFVKSLQRCFLLEGPDQSWDADLDVLGYWWEVVSGFVDGLLGTIETRYPGASASW